MTEQPVADAVPMGPAKFPGRAGLRLAAASVALVGGMIAALEWMPWMQPPLIHVLIIFVGLPAAGATGLVALTLSAAGLRRRPRARAASGLALSLVALALLGWYALLFGWR
jgi:hypothetical protein